LRLDYIYLSNCILSRYFKISLIPTTEFCFDHSFIRTSLLYPELAKNQLYKRQEAAKARPGTIPYLSKNVEDSCWEKFTQSIASHVERRPQSNDPDVK
jgi:hypothetical protein